MAKVAPPGPLSVGLMAKRKTPSELRGEQLRRTSLAELLGDSQSQTSNDSFMASEGDDGVKKPDAFRNPKYTNTRLYELYPVKKPRLRMLNVKENVKVCLVIQHCLKMEIVLVLMYLCTTFYPFSSEKFADCLDVSRDGSTKADQTSEKCSQSVFRSVTELSSFGDQSSGLAAVDMDKALKGLASCEPVNNPSFNADPSGKSDHYFDNFRSECCVPGKKPPLDFTLKTKMRLMCACSVSGLHRTLMSSTCNSSPQFVFQQGCADYSMNTSHFVVMFTNGNGSDSPKSLCRAYISQSTKNLRSLLREHDVRFSMPLCHSKMEEVATEHLVELSEIARQNLGQTRKPISSNDADNTPQSLLAFFGNQDVQGLYDFLLNYRSFLTLLSGIDVPVLYSPVPFTNAGLSAPEIRCVDMKKADHSATSPKDTSSSTLSSIIEVKGTCIPPWIISRICAIMSSEATSYEASFATEPTSIGLNIAMQKSKSDAETVEESNSSNAFGMSEAVVTPCLSSAFLTGLKYKDDSFLASLSPA
ncbi:hypothetical protein LINPERPRIM_LOCUS26908 [Linum perenne]